MEVWIEICTPGPGDVQQDVIYGDHIYDQHGCCYFVQGSQGDPTLCRNLSETTQYVYIYMYIYIFIHVSICKKGFEL